MARVLSFSKPQRRSQVFGRLLPAEPLARGVYWHSATKDGRAQAYAVDSSGDEVNRIVLDDDSWARGEAAVEFLWRHLDVVDPQPDDSNLAAEFSQGLSVVR